MRHEYKYLVPLDAAESIRELVSHFCRHDRHCEDRDDRRYTVRSVYLDTARGLIYSDKVEGLQNRVKVRVRGYDQLEPDSRVSLELKRKRGSLSWKSRATLSLSECERYLATGRANGPLREHDVEAAGTFRFFVRRHSLRPTTLVTYEREAFEGLHDPTLRVTFDTNLRGLLTDRLADLGALHSHTVYARHFILEVKFDHHYPTWMKHVLARHGLIRQALSKYVLVVRACNRGRHIPTDGFTRGRWSHHRTVAHQHT
jgi:SPX domain protein involved in polyphosphate accumulation